VSERQGGEGQRRGAAQRGLVAVEHEFLGMQPEERTEFIRANGRMAEQEYQALVERLDETLSGFEPFHVLSLVSLVVVVGAMSGSKGFKGIGQAHAELLQALILRCKRHCKTDPCAD